MPDDDTPPGLELDPADGDERLAEAVAEGRQLGQAFAELPVELRLEIALATVEQQRQRIAELEAQLGPPRMAEVDARQAPPVLVRYSDGTLVEYLGSAAALEDALRLAVTGETAAARRARQDQPPADGAPPLGVAP